jgi:hypothetical protein
MQIGEHDIENIISLGTIQHQTSIFLKELLDAKHRAQRGNIYLHDRWITW